MTTITVFAISDLVVKPVDKSIFVTIIKLVFSLMINDKVTIGYHAMLFIITSIKWRVRGKNDQCARQLEK